MTTTTETRESNDERFLAYLKTRLTPSLMRSAIDAMIEQVGVETVETQLMIASQRVAMNPFATTSISSDSIPAPEGDVERIWFGLYPETVNLFIGDSGAGKSSLLYNIAVCAARNEPLYGINFGANRPLRVHYIDPENFGRKCARKLSRINKGAPSNLVFCSGVGVNLSDPAQMAYYREYVREQRFDVVIIDPLANLMGTENENDNSEAARQMAMLTSLSRATGACVIVVHHTGADKASATGRGATARIAGADVALLFRASGTDENVDDTFNGTYQERREVCRLQIVKNRLEGRGSLYLQMMGADQFEVSSFAQWKARANRDRSANKTVQAQDAVQTYLLDGNWHSRAEIVTAMAREGIGQVTTDAALKALRDMKIVTERREGRGATLFYLLSSFLPAPEAETQVSTNQRAIEFIAEEDNSDEW